MEFRVMKATMVPQSWGGRDRREARLPPVIGSAIVAWQAIMDVGPSLSFGKMDMGGGAVVFGMVERARVEMGFTGKTGGAIGHRCPASRAEEAFDIRGGAVESGACACPAPGAILEAEE